MQPPRDSLAGALKVVPALIARLLRKERIMIAMSLLSAYDETRRDRNASVPVYPTPVHPLHRAMANALAMMGLGVRGRSGQRINSRDWLK